MKTIITSLLSLLTIATVSATSDTIYVEKHDTVYIAKAVVIENVPDTAITDTVAPERNNWRAKLKESNFHLGVDIMTKYVWRGIEMMPESSAPVLFPRLSYEWKGLYIYAMGGYAVNGKFAEIDLGISYTWKGLSVCFNDYYYPTLDCYEDQYFTGGKQTGHWLEGCISYAPEKVPIWATVSTFFYGADKYLTDEGAEKQAYSTYIELGAYYDFLHHNRISLGLGAAVNKSCYNNYEKGFSVCNIDLKYTYNVTFKSGWTLPLSAELIYNPVFDKMHFNLTASIGF